MALVTEANRRWWALGALAFSLFMITLDNTVVTVALRAIQEDLHTSVTQLEWVVNAYTLTYAVLLISGGKLADFLGRRRIFLVGLVVFTLSSLWCALSTSGGELIAARAVQGSGAALMLPATLSVITAIFPPEQRGAAVGIWAGVSGAALALGPLVGGALVDAASWSWIFYINVPTGIIGIVCALALVPESRDTSVDQRLDILGLLTSGAATFLLTFALVEANNYGWSSGVIVGCFVGSAVAFAAFLVLELRQRLPMIEIGLFRNASFAGANFVGLATFISLLGVIFFLSLYLQIVLGYSALQAGAAFLSTTIPIMFMAPLGGRLTDRYGPRWPMSLGLLVWGASLFVLAAVLETDSTFWQFFPILVFGGFGFGFILPPSTVAVLRAVPTDKSGVASGVLQAIRQLGGALGVAVMGSIITAQTADLVPGAPEYAAKFVHGLHWVLVFGGAVACVGGLVGVATGRSRPGSAEAPVLSPGTTSGA